MSYFLKTKSFTKKLPLLIKLLIILCSCSKFKWRKESAFIDSIICDAEKINKKGNRLLSTCGDYEFKGIGIRTDEKAFSGSYSLKLAKKSKFGFTFLIQNVIPGDIYQVSIWKYGSTDDGRIIVSSEKPEEFYISENSVVLKKNNWSQIVLNFIVPLNMEYKNIIIYAWKDNADSVYFDDIIIKKLSKEDYFKSSQKCLEIYLDSTALQKIIEKRAIALKKGILITEPGDRVKAVVIYGKDTMTAEIRLKGDWIDHLYGYKWSFRIKLNSKCRWKNMREFSIIQKPSTRSFLNEWVAYKIFLMEDLLATKYGFVPVSLDGKNFGIYAYEEHFEKHLLEGNNRKEGPMLKFTDEHLWLTREKTEDILDYYKFPCYEASEIAPFKENRILRSPVLYSQLLAAHYLINEYKWFKGRGSEIFNIDNLAKYYALLDLTKAYHNVVYINQRFYYNPFTCKLEPILYDCFPDNNIYRWPDLAIMGNRDFSIKNINIESICSDYIFSDPTFLKKYVVCLQEYSDKSFIKTLYDSLYPDILAYEKLLNNEYPFFSYDSLFISDNAKRIREELPKYKERIRNNPYYANLDYKKYFSDINYKKTDNLSLALHYVVAHANKRMNNSAQVNIINYFNNDIEVVGYCNHDSKPDKYPEKPLLIKAYRSVENFTTLDVKEKTDYIFIRNIAKHSQLYPVSIYKWAPPNSIKNHNNYNKLKRSNIDNFRTINYSIIIDRKHVLSNPAIIPEGFVAVFRKGSILDLTNNSTFISYSPVVMKGTKNNPVTITSTDGSAMEFTILQAKGKSIIRNAIFNNLKTFNYNGWSLTGAVNLYESDIYMTNVTFQNNRCADALNIIRSKFRLTNCTFDNIFADAFDSNFCESKIENSRFKDIDNDATDFSGSAVASRDLSKITVINSLISNSKYCFVAFQKKPEYSKAEINSINTKLENILIGFNRNWVNPDY